MYNFTKQELTYAFYKEVVNEMIDGYFDGYGRGLSGIGVCKRNRPKLLIDPSHQWLKRYPLEVRRRFVRGFAVGTFKYFTMLEQIHLKKENDETTTAEKD